MWSQATRRFSSGVAPTRFNATSITARSTQFSVLRAPMMAPALLKSGATMQNNNSKGAPTLQQQHRSLFDWALRPYAVHSAANAATTLTGMNAGFSNVGLSLLVAPWKALPTVLVIAPMMYAVPALYKMLFSNCSRGAVNSVFSGFCQFTLVFLPVPSFENLFAELTFYITALCLTFFMYNLLPELMLEDSIWIFYSALFMMPWLPLAFAYMPTFAPRSYLIL